MTGVVNVLDSILSVGHGVQRQATHVEVEEPFPRKDFQNGGCLATFEEDQVQPAMKNTVFLQGFSRLRTVFCHLFCYRVQHVCFQFEFRNSFVVIIGTTLISKLRNSPINTPATSTCQRLHTVK